MKKRLLLFTGLASLAAMVFGGGIVTNSNQSIAWVRTMVRDASISTDAVYFNPAGLVRMNDGFHFSLNAQSIWQNKDVTNDYSYLDPTPKKYEGEIFVPVFPSLYASWKKNKLAVSFGFNPIGGGGGATFEDGLPSFELSTADMVPTLASYGASAYRQDVFFKGTSTYMGYQLGISYKINELISVYGGVRYVTAKNTYEGHLRDVEVNMSGSWVNVSDAFTNLSIQAALGASTATGLANSMGTLIGAGIPGTATLADAESLGAIDAVTRAQIEGGLAAIGVPPTLQIEQIESACNTAAPQFEASAAQAAATAEATDVVFNQEADVVQKGSGITPIIGLHLAISEKLNVGLKFEFPTKIELTNETAGDFITDYNPVTAETETMFPDGEKIRGDLPAMFSAGVDYMAVNRLKISAGVHYYWDRPANYGKKLNDEYVKNSEVIDDNYFELAMGIEYGITEKLLASAGFLHAHTGVSEDYQSDLSFSLTSNTVGGGLGFRVSENFLVNAGVSYTIYNEGSKTYDHYFQAGDQDIQVTDTYFKDNLIVGLGVDFSF